MNGRPALLSTTTSNPIVEVKTLFYVGKTTQTQTLHQEKYIFLMFLREFVPMISCSAVIPHHLVA